MAQKKIIGYKAPCDMFGGVIRKGEVYKKQIGTSNLIYYALPGKGYTLPPEIVEKWKPVYEEEEKIHSMGEFNLTIKGDKVFHKSEDITDFICELVESFPTKKLFDGHDATIQDVTFSSTGCQKSKTSLSQWRQVYDIIKAKL